MGKNTVNGVGQQPIIPMSEPADDATASPATTSDKKTTKHLPESPYKHKDSKPIHEMGVMETVPTSNIKHEVSETEGLEKEYINHCDRLAELEGRQEVTSKLRDILQYIQAPDTFDTSCGFEIKYVSKTGKVEVLLPPQEGMSKARQRKLLDALKPRVNKIDEEFVKDGRDEELKEAIDTKKADIKDTYKRLMDKAPESNALKYKPKETLEYELTANLPNWPLTKDLGTSGSFVIEVKSPVSDQEQDKPEHRADAPRTILRPAAIVPTKETGNEPDILELPGITDIRPLHPDAPIFLPPGDKSTAATATIIGGDTDSNFALPESISNNFDEQDVLKFQTLHALLSAQNKKWVHTPDDDLEKMSPDCLRQSFCDNSGDMGTTFVHVFAENKVSSPHSLENKNNKIMVLWYPKKGFKATLENVFKVNTQVINALNKYQREAFWYNERPSYEQGPSLARDLEEFNQSKPDTASQIKGRKLKTTDPEKPTAFPVVTAARIHSLPHEASLKRSPTNEEDNQALNGIRTALHGVSEKQRFLAALELPERFISPEENSEPAVPEQNKLSNQNQTRIVSTPLPDEDDDLDAVLAEEKAQDSVANSLLNESISDAASDSLTSEDSLDAVIREDLAQDPVANSLLNESVSDAASDSLTSEDRFEAAIRERKDLAQDSVANSLLNESISDAASDSLTSEDSLDAVIREDLAQDPVANSLLNESVSDAASDSLTSEDRFEAAIRERKDLAQDSVANSLLNESISDAASDSLTSEDRLEAVIREREDLAQDPVANPLLNESISDATSAPLTSEGKLNAAIKRTAENLQVEMKLKKRKDSLQLFDDQTANSIIHTAKSIQSDNKRASGIKPPENAIVQHVRIIDHEDYASKEAVFFNLYVEGSISQIESVKQQIMGEFSKQMQNFLTDYLTKHGTFKDIPDSTVINMIYAALPSPGNRLLEQGGDYRILISINGYLWLLNRKDSGNIRTLCIPHNNFEIQEVHADNKKPETAHRLAQAVYKTNEVEKKQLEDIKRLPAVSKLPMTDKGGYYLLMEQSGLDNVMPEQEIVQFIKDRHGQQVDIRDELTTELTKRMSQKPAEEQRPIELLNITPPA